MSIKIFAHRGYSGAYPENTMVAFKEAIEGCKCDGIELDVHLTKDDKLVIIHDETVDRTTNKKGYVKDFTLEELKKLNANYKFSNLSPVQSIPSFYEYCEYIRDKDIITNIELKTNLIYYKDIEQKVINQIKKYDLQDRVILSSFNHSSSIIAKNIDENISCGLLVEKKGIINCGYYSKKLNMNSYHPNIRFLTKEIVNECKKYKIDVNTWTVNTKEDFYNCKKWGVSGIITNYPNKIKRYISE